MKKLGIYLLFFKIARHPKIGLEKLPNIRHNITTTMKQNKTKKKLYSRSYQNCLLRQLLDHLIRVFVCLFFILFFLLKFMFLIN